MDRKPKADWLARERAKRALGTIAGSITGALRRRRDRANLAQTIDESPEERYRALMRIAKRASRLIVDRAFSENDLYDDKTGLPK